jgi:hypothetical protein
VGRKPGMGYEIRMRTMRASADSELGLITSKRILALCDEFPELEIRLQVSVIEALWLVNDGHGASLRHHNGSATVRTGARLLRPD